MKAGITLKAVLLVTVFTIASWFVLRFAVNTAENYVVHREFVDLADESSARARLLTDDLRGFQQDVIAAATASLDPVDLARRTYEDLDAGLAINMGRKYSLVATLDELGDHGHVSVLHREASFMLGRRLFETGIAC